MNPIPKEVKDLLTWTPEQVDLKAHSRLHYPEKYFPKAEYGEICTPILGALGA